MSDKEQVLDQARRLAEVLAAHPRFQGLREAENAVRASEDARKISDDLNAQMEKIADLETRAQPIEPEDKVLLEQLREKVHANELLQDLARVQADYLELMEQVNRIIREGLTAEDAPSQPQGD